MSLFKSVSITVTEKSTADGEKGAYVKGRWVPGEDLDPVIEKGTVQPISAYRQQTLPEGLRGKSGLMEVILSAKHSISDQVAGTEGAVVDWGNGPHILVMRGDWQNGLLPHYEYIAEPKLEGARA